jgi:signal transduction histidine kinase
MSLVYVLGGTFSTHAILTFVYYLSNIYQTFVNIEGSGPTCCGRARREPQRHIRWRCAKARSFGQTHDRARDPEKGAPISSEDYLDRQRRQLMADIAHELRTPLSVIQGRIEGLLDGVYPRDDGQLSQVLAETRMLARLIDDLRTLAHAEGGTLTLQKEPTDVAILAQEVVDAFAGEAMSGDVSISLSAPPNLPLVCVDPLRLREILINLLSNALHHTPAKGVISIDLSAISDRMTVKVADTGTGIAADDLPRIFDRFHKGATSRGSGLGLAIARNLVAAHGGDIQAESQPGRGTTITFSLQTGE